MPTAQPSFTPRALLIGLLAVVALSVGTQYAELWIHGTQVSQSTPPINSFFVWIIVLALLNTILHAIKRGFALSRGELLLIYSMLIVTGGLVGIGLVHFIPSMITAPIYYGTPEQPWAEIVEPLVPTSEWFAPRNEAVIKYLHEGMPPTWTVPWGHWVRPLASWSLLGLLLGWCTICVSALLRHQWVENERLIFPLNYVPLAMTEPVDSMGKPTPPDLWHPFFRNKLMWLGFAVPTVLHAFNSLHQYAPSLPELRIRDVRIDTGFTARPWNAMRPLSLWFYPMAVGLAYLLSRDISFSLWFFYFIGKAEAVIGSALGLSSGGVLRGFPFIEEQSSGALLMLALGSLWVARKHLGRLWRAATGKAGEESGRLSWLQREALSPQVSIWGLLVGLALIVVWWQLAGMSPRGTLLYFVLFFLYAIGLSRLVCEGGTVWIGTPVDPRLVLRNGLGVGALSPQDWTMMGYLRFLTMDWRCLMMPNVMSAFKFTETDELRPRGLALSMMLAITVATVVSFVTVIYMAYTTPGGGIGLSTWRFVGVPQEPFKITGQFLTERGAPVYAKMWFMGAGGLVMLALQALRTRFLWWPLHPLGYPMAGTFAMRNMWFSTLVAWAIKTVVLRYGGIPVYERSRPLFLGLILGDFFNIALWLVIEGFTGVQDHFLYP